MRFLLTLSALVSVVFAEGRTEPPDGAVTVGSGGDYDTLQAAVDSGALSIFILAGTYNEQVTIPESSDSLAIYGYTEDTSSYSGNVVSIENSASQASGEETNQATATINNEAPNTKFYNIDIKNTYGKGSQAVALAAYNTAQGYYGVGLYSYQDTLLSEVGNQFYGAGYIEGATDFIFGQEARAWVDNTDIGVSGNGYVTANGRDSDDNESYYVINNSRISASADSAAESGGVYLGRPWRNYARVTVQNTDLSDVINRAGWRIWNDDDERTDNVSFEEYGNTGDGASGTRASFSSQLDSAVDIATILGSDYVDWVDAAYL